LVLALGTSGAGEPATEKRDEKLNVALLITAKTPLL